MNIVTIYLEGGKVSGFGAFEFEREADAVPPKWLQWQGECFAYGRTTVAALPHRPTWYYNRTSWDETDVKPLDIYEYTGLAEPEDEPTSEQLTVDASLKIARYFERRNDLLPPEEALVVLAAEVERLRAATEAFEGGLNPLDTIETRRT